MNKTFKLYIFLVLILVITSCQKKPNSQTTKKNNTVNSTSNETTKAIKRESSLNKDNEGKNEIKDYCGFIDSMISIKFDTSTIEGKAKTLINSYNLKHWEDLFYSTGDSLIDINYDGLDDLLIYYNRPAGTGLKVGVQVHCFDVSTNNFNDTPLISFENPSFYLQDKEITELYIALGGGYGSLYKWLNGKWRATKNYNFYPSENDGPSWKVEIVDTKTNDTSYTYQKDNFTVPSNEILRNKYN